VHKSVPVPITPKQYRPELAGHNPGAPKQYRPELAGHNPGAHQRTQKPARVALTVREKPSAVWEVEVTRIRPFDRSARVTV